MTGSGWSPRDGWTRSRRRSCTGASCTPRPRSAGTTNSPAFWPACRPMRTAAARRPNYRTRRATELEKRMAIIEARGLARTFTSRKRTVEAVRGVDLTVSEGEIVGFLGPNGAGKTTTLRMLTTLLRPTAGTATVAGADLMADPVGVRSRIGYVPQAIGATGGGSDPSAKVAEELTFQAQLYRVPARDIPARVALLIAQLDLTGLEDRLV